MNEKESFFGKNLKWIRNYHRISQGGLAEKLNLKRNNIASYELGNSQPNLTRAIKIARYFSLSLELMVLTDFETNPPKLKLKSLIEERIEDMIERQGDNLKSWRSHFEMLSTLVKGYETMFAFDDKDSLLFSFSNQDTQRIIRLLNRDKEVIEQMLAYVE